MKIINQS